VNSLAAREFSHHFGKAKVWQVTPDDIGSHHSKAVAQHMRGRFCFLGSPKYQDLVEMEQRGAVLKETTLTDKFTLKDFRQTYGEDALILFMKDPEKGLRPIEADLEDIPVNSKIYAYVIEQKTESTQEDEQ